MSSEAFHNRISQSIEAFGSAQANLRVREGASALDQGKLSQLNMPNFRGMLLILSASLPVMLTSPTRLPKVSIPAFLFGSVADLISLNLWIWIHWAMVTYGRRHLEEGLVESFPISLGSRGASHGQPVGR